MKNNKGFTLIELLVVVAIIGILAAIAIPQFALYRQRGFDARAESDLRNAATAEEAYFVDFSEYQSCAITGGGCDDPTLPGFRVSPDVEGDMVGTVSNFTGTASHPNGSGRVFSWDSDGGGLSG